MPQEMYVCLNQVGSESPGQPLPGDGASPHTARTCLFCSCVIEHDALPVYADWLIGYVHESCYERIVANIPRLDMEAS